MPSIGRNCHELRINDENSTWRVMYRVDDDAIVIVAVFSKKTAQTPKAVIDHIAQASRTAMAEPAYQQKLLNAGYRPDADSTAEKLQEYIRYDLDRWAPLIKQLGLKLD